ncbi:GNAT family N-acetyltransferase [Leifsonia sp. NPDC077715]|uniref:GNAT family N-acetyltransferase n=1 Tax=Leifsonia sp. NPDC077715 TaxID=3155539 RepID=UPI0034269B9B
MTVRIEPATVERWADIAQVFGPQGRRADSCWCQRFRDTDAPDNRAALHEEIAHADTPVALIAYDEADPVGWTRVVPRSTLPGIIRNRALARILDDDPSAWWATCFVVRRDHRGEGIGVQLLAEAVDWARRHGASVLDGHPVDTDLLTGAPAPSAVFTGTLRMFEEVGFTELGRTFPSRPVMRYVLSE